MTEQLIQIALTSKVLVGFLIAIVLVYKGAIKLSSIFGRIWEEYKAFRKEETDKMYELLDKKNGQLTAQAQSFERTFNNLASTFKEELEKGRTLAEERHKDIMGMLYKKKK